MQFLRLLFILLTFALAGENCFGQNSDSLFRIDGFIYDESVIPLPYTHIINLNSGRGNTSGPFGNFSFNAERADSILFRNLAYKDLIIIANMIRPGDTVHMKIMLYPIREVKIFEWGSTYADFKAKMKSMPVTENLSEKLGLPQQHGNPIPNFRNTDVLKNPMFAYTNPIDFLYFNLNKKEQSIRKVLEFEQNKDLISRFESVYNRKNISTLTGLDGAELDAFMIYLNLKFQCDFNCSEIQVVEEVYKHWKDYRNIEK
jgi:hypothetical protein